MTGERLGDESGDLEFEYVVDSAGNLNLLSTVSSSSGTWTKVRVYKKVDSLCGFVSSVPDEPGDSYSCDVTNCGCSEAIEGPADQDTCDYISGY